MPGTPVYKGEMTFTPDTGATIFRNQIVRCVVTYTASPEDENIPDKVIKVGVNFKGGVWPDNETLPQESGFPTLSLSSGGQSPPVYQGDFYAFAPSNLRGGSDIGYEIVLNNYAGETASLWDLASKPATTVCSLDRAIVPVNESNNLNADEPFNKVIMKVSVTNSAGDPAPDYAVYWSDDDDATVFKDVNAFADQERLEPAPLYKSDLAPRSSVIHGITDKHGVARLTLVTRKDPCRLAVSCWTQPQAATNMDPVAVYAPETIDYNFSAPSVNLPTENGKYNLDKAGSNMVPVTISTASFERDQQYDIFIFINGENVQYQEVSFPSGEPLPPEISVFLAKALFRSDSNSESGKEPNNELFYVVSSNQGGCKTSVSTGKFHCIGDPGKYEPDPLIEPRDLPAPVVEDAGSVVNVNTIENGLRLSIPLKADKGWTPKDGDLITSTIYLHGWDLWTNEQKGNVFDDPVQITANDIAAGSIISTYNSAKLRGFVPNQSGPDQATFYAEYYVVPKGEANSAENRIYSEYVELNLDTGG